MSERCARIADSVALGRRFSTSEASVRWDEINTKSARTIQAMGYANETAAHHLWRMYVAGLREWST